jgi:hypothetical protein
MTVAREVLERKTSEADVLDLSLLTSATATSTCKACSTTMPLCRWPMQLYQTIRCTRPATG